MKQPACTAMLATVALVGSLALGAQAGPRPTLASAKQIHGSSARRKVPSIPAKTSFHRILFPDNYSYLLDNGHADDVIGTSGDLICLNEFTVAPGGNNSISSVSIAWGSPNFPDPTLNGLTFTAVLWSAPAGGGNPSQAIVVATGPGTISQAGTDSFVTISAPCFHTAILTTDFFVGFIIHSDSGQFPASFDETPPILGNRSYVAAGQVGDIFHLGLNDLPVAPIENYGYSGNWLIRAEASIPPPRGDPGPTLWYNGDFNGVNGLYNEQDGNLGAGQYGRVYEDFNVPDPSGWDVITLVSNNLTDFPTTCVMGATWEIRQGITPGDGGTLIASGMTTTPLVSMTGRSAYGYNEYRIQVEHLSVHLPQGDGYFLNVTPIGDGYGGSFVSTTSGANAVGSPPGNDQNAFFDSNYFGQSFVPTGDWGQPYDYSMAVYGTVSIVLESSASRLAQGPAGNFDIPLPGIEDRDAPSRSLIVFTFDHDVAGAVSATTSCGSVQSIAKDPNDSRSLIAALDALGCDQQTATVTLSVIYDYKGAILGSASTTVSFHFGDVNGDGRVNRKDRQVIRAAQGQQANSTNFHADLNADGIIDRQDVALFKTFHGDSLP